MICNHHRNYNPPGGVDYRQGQPGPAWTVTCSCVETYEAIVRGEDIPKLEAYCAIVREAAKHPDKLTHYAADLIVHDRNVLTDYRGPFLWILRELGTHIVIPHDGTDRQDWTGAMVLKCFAREPGHLYFWWDGRALKACRDAVHGAEKLDEENARMRRAAQKGRAA